MRARRRPGPVAALLVALLAVAGACSSEGDTLVADGATTSTSASAGADAGSGSPGAPGGGEGPLFVSVDAEGGFVLAGHDFRSLPSAVVYEDGTTFSPGAMIEVYPGPPVLPVVQGQLGEEQLAEIARAAADAGLTSGATEEIGAGAIADAATTTVTVVLDGVEHVVSVAALGAEAVPGSGGVGDDERREAVRAFVDLVSRLVVEAEEGIYEPDRYRVLPLEPEVVGGEELDPDVREWPLGDVELQVRRCTAVTGAQAEELRRALDGATEITRWRTSAGETFVLVVRPLLPHEPDCPEEAEAPGDAAD